MDSPELGPPSEVGDAHATGRLLNSAARDISVRKFDDARSKLLSALASYERARDPLGAAMALYNLGVVDFSEGRHADAAAHFESAVTVVGDSSTMVDSLARRGISQTATDHESQGA